MASVVRLLLLGNEAGRWVGYAKKLANFCIRDNIPQKTVILDGVQIHVQVANNDAKVTIHAGGEHYYQFVFTGPVPIFVGDAVQGSAVAVSLPILKPPDFIPDWTKVRAFPTGSTIEGNEESRWPVFPPGAEGMQSTTWVRNINQVQLIPEPVYVEWDSVFHRARSRTVYSWSSVEPVVRMAGALSPYPAFTGGDRKYDASPTPLVGARVPPWQMPDSDWPHDVCRCTVTDTQWGSRTFLIMADAFGAFYCWAMGTEKEPFERPEYAAQGYRANVAKAERIIPPYPSWVKRPTAECRDYWNSNGHVPISPRNVARFHPQGTAVVVMAFERTPANWALFKQNGRDDEVSVGTAKVFDLDQVGGDPESKADVELDVPGWVEFLIEISLNGPEPDDFSFAMEVGRSEKAAGTRWPIAAAYLGEVPNSTWGARGIIANPGDLVIAVLRQNTTVKALESVERHHGWGRFLFSEAIPCAWAEIGPPGGSPFATIPLNDAPEVAEDLRHTIPFPEVREGAILQMDLTTLSWVIAYTRSVQEVTGGSSPTVNSPMGVVCTPFRQAETCGMGIETTVYGKSVRRLTGGALDPWTWRDSFSPRGISVDVGLRGTYWFVRAGIAGVFVNSQFHWLLDKAIYFLGNTLAERRSPEEEDDPEWLPASKAQFLSMTNKLLEDKRDYPPYNEIEPRFLGPHAKIAKWCQTYTADYWNTYVVDELWDIFQDAVARKNSGDFSTASLTSSGPYLSGLLLTAPRVHPNHDKLTLGLNADVYLPRVYDAEIGVLAYHFLWRGTCATDPLYRLKLLDNGYYAGRLAIVCPENSITTWALFKSDLSGKWTACKPFPTAGYTHVSSVDVAPYVSLHPDASSAITYQDDFIGHINTDSTYTHLAAYNVAYDRVFLAEDFNFLAGSFPQQHTFENRIYNVVSVDGTPMNVLLTAPGIAFGAKTFVVSTTMPLLNGAMQMG